MFKAHFNDIYKHLCVCVCVYVCLRSTISNAKKTGKSDFAENPKSKQKTEEEKKRKKMENHPLISLSERVA